MWEHWVLPGSGRYFVTCTLERRWLTLKPLGDLASKDLSIYGNCFICSDGGLYQKQRVKPQGIKLDSGFTGAYNLIEEAKLVGKREFQEDINISDPMWDWEQVTRSNQRFSMLKRKKKMIQCPLDVRRYTSQHDIEACNQTITDFHVYY